MTFFIDTKSQQQSEMQGEAWVTREQYWLSGHEQLAALLRLISKLFAAEHDRSRERREEVKIAGLISNQQMEFE